MIKLTLQQLIDGGTIVNEPVALDEGEDPWTQYFPADGYHLQLTNPENHLMMVKVEVIQVHLYDQIKGLQLDLNEEPEENLVVFLDEDGDVLHDCGVSKLFDITVSRELTTEQLDTPPYDLTAEQAIWLGERVTDLLDDTEDWQLPEDEYQSAVQDWVNILIMLRQDEKVDTVINDYADFMVLTR